MRHVPLVGLLNRFVLLHLFLSFPSAISFALLSPSLNLSSLHLFSPTHPFDSYYQLESAGFEIKNIDVLGVHYSATIFRWYTNWVSNRDKVVEKYGERWYRIWVFFLAWSTIVSRSVLTHFVANLGC